MDLPSAIQISSDSALIDPKEDRLGIANFSQNIARAVVSDFPRSGIVAALYGQWGLGKTTVLNFIERELLEIAPNDVRVIRFNPWWFSASEDLVQRFFQELSASINVKSAQSQRLKEQIGRYAEILAETPIPYASLGKAVSKTVKQGKSIVTVRRDLEKLLQNDRRITVVISDDIDRLSNAEIGEMFRVAKSVANLPKLVYLLAFDRELVQDALKTIAPGRGHEYLEKIVQIAFDIPLPEPTALAKMLGERIQPVFLGTPPELWSDREFSNLLVLGLMPLIHTPRAAIRYANSLQITYPPLRDDVHGVDFLAIEGLRLLVPSVYDAIRKNPQYFLSDGVGLAVKEGFTKFHQDWLSTIPEQQRTAVTQLVSERFPKTKSVFTNTTYGSEWFGQWDRQRRVCISEHFNMYFKLDIAESAFRRADLRQWESEAFDRYTFRDRLLWLRDRKTSSGGSKAIAWIDELRAKLRPDANQSEKAEWTTPPTPKDLKELALGLSDAADPVLQSEDSPAFFSVPQMWPVMWLIRNVLKQLQPSDRVDLMSRMLRTSESAIFPLDAFRWFVRPEKKSSSDPDEDALLFTDDARSKLDQDFNWRVERAEATVETPEGVPVDDYLRAAKMAFGIENTRSWLASKLMDDDFFLKFLERFSRKVSSVTVGDVGSTIHWEGDVASLLEWVDWPTLEQRFQSIPTSLFTSAPLQAASKAIMQYRAKNA